MVFYDKYGTPSCYSEDSEHIYSYSGEPLGYIRDNRIWNYNGRYLGLYKNGWVLDKEGCYFLFTENATGGPIKPIKKIASIKSIKTIRPVKSIREIPPIPPMTKHGWSDMEFVLFWR